MKEALKLKLQTLPKQPGCYLMKDRFGTVIYVGKAINLKNRVNSYFVGAHNYKTTKLVSNIDDFAYIVTNSEKEALILEYNLIKEYDPQYNIIFKDDKSYPYILLSEDAIPYCKTIRISKKVKYRGKIFGPYPNIGAANNIINLINKLFPSRKCRTLGKDVCLYYHLGQCKGYCKYQVDQQECQEIKDQIECFLKGDNQFIINGLKKKIDVAVDNLEFEKAAEYRDLIADINYVTNNRQSVQSNNHRDDFDVFNYYVQDNYLSIVGLFIRNGRLINRALSIEHLYGDPQEEFISYLYQFYATHLNPKILVVDKDIDSEILSSSLNFKVKFFNRGFKYQMLKHAYDNARVNLQQKITIIEKDDAYLMMIANEFKKIIGFSPKRIELFDNSHIGGELTCSAMVVYENLKPNKKEYRLYRLEDSFDDLKSMHEAMYRRYFRVLSDDLPRPDLIIVDGGMNQINVAKEIIDGLNLNIKIVGLGKNRHHNTAYLMNSDLEIIDIDPESKIFMYLANMQDEVHRFAIEYNRRLRKKKVYASKLDNIAGLGKKRKLALLKKYQTIAKIETLSLDELQTVLPRNVAENVYNKLKGDQ